MRSSRLLLAASLAFGLASTTLASADTLTIELNRGNVVH